ncbi:MAG: ElyC/SanA/YdcF family protein, partial [Anaerolineaceae bacterium]
NFAVELGVPPEDIVLDYAGRRTYDTCYRARDIFQVRKALLVTQRFHLPRALFLCQTMGLEAYGVNADQLPYTWQSQVVWNIREIPATLVAFWEALIT